MLADAPLKCRWLLLFLFCAPICSLAQVKADFVADPVSGCAPLVVNFSDLSKGNPTSWKWDLGNGTISFLQNPSVTYFTPGQYNVKLVVRNATGVDSIIKSKLITVQASPVVSFLSDPLTGCYPLPVSFSDQSIPGSGTITTREWDFGDGNISGLQNPTHTYSSAGNFNVSLRITNSVGCVTTMTKAQYIKINTGVKADFTNNTPNSCNPPVTITFTNKSVGTGVLTYQWDFGDGTSSALTSPAHIFTATGSYNVRLIVKNSTGCADTLTKMNAITLGNVNANISLPAIACEGTPLNMLSSSIPVPGSAHWDFGDGSTADSLNPTKIYAVAGNYVIKMTANFGACKDSISKAITVLKKPVINFTADATNSCKAPFTVNFTNSSSGINTYKWDFGDNSSSIATNPSHTYKSQGIYTVKLIGSNAAGCADSVIKVAYIQIQSPSIDLPGMPVKGCAPFTYTFSPSIQSVDPIISYSWNFGDGTTGSGVAPTHQFINAGSYNIQVTITTQGGCTFTNNFPNAVQVGIKPKANFTVDQRDVCASVNLNFTDLSTGTIDKWLWEFGDGGIATDSKPGHTYQDTGYFDVRLIVWNAGCSDTIKFDNYIHIKPPVAAFSVSHSCGNPFQKTFTDLSIGADTWEWDFGDNTTSDIPSPVHSYSSAGTYIVKLKVTNNSTGCSYTKTETIPVIIEKADFTVSSDVICKRSSTNFHVLKIIPENVEGYFWDFGDGTRIWDSVPDIVHFFLTAGHYSVTLVIKNKLGCYDTLTKNLFIEVDGPTANFNSLQPGTCTNNSLTFIDSSNTDGTHTLSQWTWDYGDGTLETLTSPPFQHIYKVPGTYTVSLVVVDNKGCSDKIVKTNSVVISKPVASFYSNDTLTCSGQPIQFNDLSSGPGLTYAWDFGDGASSNMANPVHQYNKQGIYSVSLTITDMYGCTSTVQKLNYINVSNPKAAFLMSDSVSTCPPLVVTFTNTSVNAIDHTWDFGDGTTSQLKDPTHFYSTPGIFTVVLRITGPGGCIDTMARSIVVKGPSGSFTYTNISGCNPLQTSFRGTTTRNISFVWDFNDGTTITTPDSIIKHTYTNPGNYLPKMILVDVNGCRVPVTGIDTIRVYGINAGFTVSKRMLCDSGAVQFTDSSITNDVVSSYLWDFGDGTTSALKNPTHTYSTTGSYVTKLVVTSQSGCTDTALSSTPVKIIASPKIGIAGGNNSCIPVLTSFTGQVLTADTSLLTWKWDMDNGKVYTQKDPPAQLYPVAKTYNIKATATNGLGCSSTVTKIIEAYPLPDIQASPDFWICKGMVITLTAKGGESYTWTPSATLSCSNCASADAKPDSTTKYYVTGSSVHGCLNRDSVVLSVKTPFKMQVGPSVSVCRGSSTIMSASGTDLYSWTPAQGLNNSNIAEPKASPSETTNYRVVGTDDLGCFSDTGYVSVKVYAIPTVNAGEDKTINVGQTIDLVPQISADVTGVNWTPTSGVFRNNYPGIAARPVESTEYTVEVVNEGGCRARDMVTVYVLCNNANVFIPNTFSPNNDGVNDMFYPRGTGLFTIKMMRIFNRWGDVVFEKGNMSPNNASMGWDGTFKGQQLNPDVFVYTIDVVCDNNTVLTYKGNIALIK